MISKKITEVKKVYCLDCEDQCKEIIKGKINIGYNADLLNKFSDYIQNPKNDEQEIIILAKEDKMVEKKKSNIIRMEDFINRDLFLEQLKEMLKGTYNKKTRHYEIDVDEQYLTITAEHLKEVTLDKMEEYIDALSGKFKEKTPGETGR